jgi:hypothetical protein
MLCAIEKYDFRCEGRIDDEGDEFPHGNTQYREALGWHDISIEKKHHE